MYRRAFFALGTLLFVTACANPPKYEGGSAVLQQCGGFPNCVNSMSGQGGQAIEPLTANLLQWRDLIQFIEQEKDWFVESRHENFVQAKVVSPVMRFRDDLQLLYLPQLEIVHVRSSSRLGISDMGVNRKRVEVLRRLLQENSEL